MEVLEQERYVARQSALGHRGAARHALRERHELPAELHLAYAEGARGDLLTPCDALHELQIGEKLDIARGMFISWLCVTCCVTQVSHKFILRMRSVRTAISLFRAIRCMSCSAERGANMETDDTLKSEEQRWKVRNKRYVVCSWANAHLLVRHQDHHGDYAEGGGGGLTFWGG